MLLSRALIALIFVASGFSKLAHPDDTAALASMHGVPAPIVAAVLAGCLELAAGLMLLVGFWTRWSAVALLVFLLPVTLLFHNPAGLGAAETQIQTTMIMKNMAIAGGLLAILVHGAGPLSLDSARGRRPAGQK